MKSGFNERYNALQRKYYQQYPEKFRARNKVRYAVRKNIIQKSKICNDCGYRTTQLQAHHTHGYSGENALKVEWLCNKCHKSKHSPAYCYEDRLVETYRNKHLRSRRAKLQKLLLEKASLKTQHKQ